MRPGRVCLCRCAGSSSHKIALSQIMCWRSLDKAGLIKEQDLERMKGNKGQSQIFNLQDDLMISFTWAKKKVEH